MTLTIETCRHREASAVEGLLGKELSHQVRYAVPFGEMFEPLDNIEPICDVTKALGCRCAIQRLFSHYRDEGN